MLRGYRRSFGGRSPRPAQGSAGEERGTQREGMGLWGAVSERMATCLPVRADTPSLLPRRPRAPGAGRQRIRGNTRLPLTHPGQPPFKSKQIPIRQRGPDSRTETADSSTRADISFRIRVKECFGDKSLVERSETALLSKIARKEHSLVKDLSDQTAWRWLTRAPVMRESTP
jgi:hypothetical protein